MFDQLRIHVPLNPEDEQGLESETLTADRVSATEFRITSSPLFAFDLSRGDLVKATKVEGGFEFQELAERGGHSTYRVFLQNQLALHDPEFLAAWAPIEAQGAVLERANDHFAAIDIPPGKDIGAIYDLLEKGESDELWEFEEAHYEPAAETGQ